MEFILYLVLGGLAGGFINGFAGTGTALFSLGFFLLVLEPVQAVAVAALISVLSGLQGVWEVRTEIKENQARVLRFILPGLIGVPVGVALLRYIDAGMLRLLVAGLLVFYGGYFGFRNGLPKFEGRSPKRDIFVGLIGGVLGGLASLSGALTAIWLSMRAWPRTRIRAVLQSYNVVVLGSTTLLLAINGAFAKPTYIALAVSVPVGLIAAQIGIMVFRRVSDDQFRRVLILLCLFMGTGIFLGEIPKYF